MSDATIVYYTANHERPDFEKRIQEEIVRASGGELPIISVSQKPIDFGENICVGQVGRSGHNAFRQFQIGAEAARTKYVIPAESDMIYPEEYFRYDPPQTTGSTSRILSGCCSPRGDTESITA